MQEEDCAMGFVHPKGEEDDDTRILMWMVANVKNTGKYGPWESDLKS